MLFNSLDFILFLPIVLILFYSIQFKFRSIVLLAASYYFYLSWNPIYLILIITSTLTDYFAGIALSLSKKGISRKLILLVSILINLGLLIYFKYANFILENTNTLVSSINSSYKSIELLDIVLPVGISFYTFQTLSYTIDVYLKKIKVERNLSVFALYVSFFPQLVAGPIERFSSLAPQFKTRTFLNRDNLSHGSRLILYGFFMKMVIADNLSIIIDNAYSDIENMHSFNLLIVAVFYSFQIYCDFHGYSTIAIGLARLFNIHLTQNFKTPYFSSSLTLFWRNWHITLTNFFRDYIYYPIGGDKQNKVKWVLALIVVFIVSGIWHGANWSFIIWGLLHGIFTLVEKLLKFNKTYSSFFVKIVKIFSTFSLVTLLWVLFRSPDIYIAKTFYYSLFTNWDLVFQLPQIEPFILLGIFIILEIFTKKTDFATQLNKVPIALRWMFYFILIFIIMSRSGTETAPFIYFQF